MLRGMGENSEIRPVFGMPVLSPTGEQGEITFLDFDVVVVLLASGKRVTVDRSAFAATWKRA